MVDTSVFSPQFLPYDDAIDSPTGKGGAVDYLDQIFGAGGLDYGFFDFRKTDRMSQDAGFSVPASNAADPIGFVIGAERQGSKTLAQSIASFALSDVLTNGNFNAGSTGWTVANADGTHIVTFSGGAMRYQSGTASPVLTVSQANVAIANGLYRLTTECTIRTSGEVKVDSVTGSASIHGATSGTYERFYASLNTSFSILRNTTNVDVTLDSVRLEKVPLHWAAQSVTNSRAQLQAGGAKYDGSDDSHLTDWLGQSGENCIMAQVGVPATISALQIIAGATAASGANAIYVGIATNGKVFAAAGATLFGVTDLRGTDAVIAIVTDGTLLKILVNGVEEASIAISTFTTSVPFAIGAANVNAASRSNYFAGTVRRIAFGKVAPPASDILKISNQWRAAA